MEKKRTLLIAAMTCFAGMASAQHTAVKMVADGHFFGARQQLERFLSEADVQDKRVGEAEALALVCDYVLQAPGTADRIGLWLEKNAASQYAAPLRDMERILLLKERREDEALALFFKAESEGECLNCAAAYTYPISGLAGEADSYNRVLYRLAGEQFYDAGDYAKAVAYLPLGEETRGSMYKLGMSHYQLTNYEQAAESLTRSAGTERDEMAQNAWLHTGLSYLQTANKKGAQTAFQQASDIKGNADVREEALYNYALTLHEGTNTGFGESVNVMERFLNDYPKSQYAGRVSDYLNEVYFTTKNYQAALASINKIKQPNAEILTAKQRVLYNLGVQTFTQGNADGALNYANQSIALGKRDAEAHAESYFLKGECEYRQGNYAAAATDLQKALAAGADLKGKALQNSDYATYTLGYALFKQHKYAQALPQFDAFVKSKLGGEKPLLASDALNRMGDCYLDSRKYDLSYDCYQKSIDTANAQGDYSLLQQAYIQGLRGNYAEKVRLLEKMKQEYANSEYVPDAMFEQGRAYVQQCNIDAANETFREIVERYPQSVNARKAGNELAMLLAESGNTDAAITAYKQMIANYPNTEEAQTALTNLKDLYTAQGRVNEYMDLAKQMGKTFTAEELDDIVHEAAVKAMTDGNYKLAQENYERLKAQTPSDDIRREAQLGIMRSAYINGDLDATIASATVVLDDASKFAPEVKSEARMNRADSYFKQGDPDSAVADLQQLATDSVTVYGAQGTVRLAQYAYETRQYESAETLLTDFIDSGTAHIYWLARAFVLLSDVYKAQGRDVEAQQTLLSLKSSYTESEEINKMVEERLK